MSGLRMFVLNLLLLASPAFSIKTEIGNDGLSERAISAIEDFKLSSGALVFFQQILYFTHTMIEHIDVVQVLHHLCYNAIAIVIHMREVLWTSLTIQTSWIHDFYMMVILIESGRHIRLIITMHHGIHHQLAQHLIGIVLHVLFSQNTNRNRPLSHNTITDEVL